MDLKTVLYAVPDLLMITAGFIYGIKFIRNYQNYLLGLEWVIIAHRVLLRLSHAEQPQRPNPD